MKKVTDFHPNIQLKWTCFLSLAIFIVFGIFSTLMYTSVKQALISSETNNVKDTMSAIDSRFNVYRSPLTKNQVQRRLTPHVDQEMIGQDRHGRVFAENPEEFYRDSLSKQLTRGDLSLVLFDINGKSLFKSGKITTDFNKADANQKIVLKNSSSRKSYLEVTMPIRRDNSGPVIGYAKINDGLRSYHKTLDELHRNIVTTVLVALLLSVILGYFLTQPLVRRINQINRTINKIDEDPDSNARIPVQKSTDEINVLAERFNHMLDRMQEYTNQQKEFVEDVSHELRTPVAVIEGHLKLLQRWGKDDPQVLEESIEASVNEISRMKNLIQEMLDLTRAEQIEVNYTNEVTEANATIEQAYNDFKMLHPDFKIDLDNTVPPNTKVQIYRNHLMQILVVLLDNAVKYSKDRKEINLSTSTEGNMLSVAVQDFGVGITQQDLQRIFNRFYRVDKARSRESGGNGLGLSIAKKIVEMYHGTITAESAVGSGTIFRVNIPLVDNKKETL